MDKLRRSIALCAASRGKKAHLYTGNKPVNKLSLIGLVCCRNYTVKNKQGAQQIYRGIPLPLPLATAM